MNFRQMLEYGLTDNKFWFKVMKLPLTLRNPYCLIRHCHWFIISTIIQRYVPLLNVFNLRLTVRSGRNTFSPRDFMYGT